MKVQCEVETDVWRAARVFSLENGDTMGGVVTSALKEFLQDRVGPKANKTPQAPRKQPSIRSYEVKKVEVAGGWSEPPKTPLSATPEPQKPAPKEGYSWCTACGKKQVKLPLFLCNDCRGDK